MWPTEQLLRLDQFFLSFRGSTGAFIAAFAVAFASSLALDILNPKNGIRKRLRESYFSTDVTLGYGAERLYAMLGKYQGDDYKAHRLFIALDLIYPLLYAVSAAIMLGYLLPEVLPQGCAAIRSLTLVPLAAALFDILENLSMLLVLNRHEADPSSRSEGLVGYSSAMTMLKIVLICATVVLPVIFLLVFLVRKARSAAPAA